MTKYFTITTGSISADQEKAIALEWKGYGWWHGVSNFWLLRDHTDSMSAASVRDAVGRIAPGTGLFVVEMKPETWAAGAMNESNRDWLKTYWPPEGK